MRIDKMELITLSNDEVEEAIKRFIEKEFEAKEGIEVEMVHFDVDMRTNPDPSCNDEVPVAKAQIQITYGVTDKKLVK
jgi:hypothetical protein